jgi:hypothetical protein
LRSSSSSYSEQCFPDPGIGQLVTHGEEVKFVV